MIIRSPIPRLGSQGLAAAARAAGFAQACHSEADAPATAGRVSWLEGLRPALLAGLPSPWSVLIALILVVM